MTSGGTDNAAASGSNLEAGSADEQRRPIPDGGRVIGDSTSNIPNDGSANSSEGAVSRGDFFKSNLSIQFGGTALEFGLPEPLHLSDFAFRSNTTLGFAEDGDKPGASQPVSDSALTTQAALLGQFVMAHFTSRSDGHGNTSTEDPVTAAIANIAPVATIGHHA